VTADVFGAAGLRAGVLGTWRASPARLREDANTEEDHARGYYRDRVIVELAQNAADAAARAGVPGRLLLRLTHEDGVPVLVAANTGAPLDAQGVASLASMRASAKREGRSVGRFGVGFAAVRAVADEVGVLSTTGGVRFSLADTAALLAAEPDAALHDEVTRRDGSLPALRLPFAAQGRPPTGYDTVVVLTLRDEVAADEVAGLLAAVGDPLLLALPALVEVVVETPERVRRVADVAERWETGTATGRLPAELLADRPVEERSAQDWVVTWAVPRAGVDWPRVVHAPTPTDDPLTLPALLVGTFPLDPTRRHVAPGALTDAVLDHAAAAYAALAQQLAAGGREPLALVPIGLPAGALDAALHERVVRALARVPLLTGPDGLLAPDRAVALDTELPGAALAALAGLVPGLVEVPSRFAAQARVLGVGALALADLVEGLPPVNLGADVYRALAAAADDPNVREALDALPVPLADGRVVRGARGAVLLDDDLDLAPTTAVRLAAWGVRVVAAGTVGPLAERLGATRGNAAGLLTHDAVRAAVLADDQGSREGGDGDPLLADDRPADDRPDDDRPDDDRPDDDRADRGAAGGVAGAVLDLVTRLTPARAERLPAWLGELGLPAADGEVLPAHGLVLPGTLAERLFDERILPAIAVEAVDRWGPDALRAVGVRAGLVEVRVDDVVADPDDEPTVERPAGPAVTDWLDGWPEYLAHVAARLGAGAWLGELRAVADLDAVVDDAWPEALAAVVAEHRSALVEPVRDSHGRCASYTAWWLTRRFGVFGLPGTPLLPPMPAVYAGLPPDVLAALGGSTLADLDLDAWSAVLDALPAGRPVDPGEAAAVWRALSRVSGEGRPPEHVVALVGPDRAAVVHAQDAAVADSPMWLQRTDLAALVAVLGRAAGAAGVEHEDVTALPDPSGTAAAVAAALDLPLASDLADGRLDDDPGAQGAAQPVPEPVRRLLAAAAPGRTPPVTWWEHDELRVDGAPVDWWVTGDEVHTVHLAGLAAGLAQLSGCSRWALEAVLTDPSRADEAVLSLGG